jgi:hypothetical protein
MAAVDAPGRGHYKRRALAARALAAALAFCDIA